MKKTILLTLALAVSGFGGEWTGFISDSSCGASNANTSAESKECAKRCVNNGAAPVFVTDGKVITISNPNSVKQFVGEKVKVKGALDKGTLKVDTIAKAD